MATDLRPARPSEYGRQPAAGKYESFVEGQLARARRRIRALDLAAAGLGFLILTLTYSMLMALVDRWLELAPLARQFAFGFYGLLALAYLAWFVVRPLLQPINPYYAAHKLEESLPEAKNSVINWLDLRQDDIAPVFRQAIGHRAARDLARADLEQAISARRTSWLGGGAFGLFLALLILYVMSPQQFLSLMKRAFAPFVEGTIATRTRLELRRPEGGNVTVPVGRPVGFEVWVEGRVPDAARPDALKLLYRYAPGSAYQERGMERGDSDRLWISGLRPEEVQTGFWYKITGGDAETPEYRVQVRSTPLLTGFDVTYHYRPYLRWRDETTHDQNLHGYRGSQVTLVAHTNRKVKDGQLEIEGQPSIAADLVAEDPQALRFRLVLDKDGKYRIRFTSVEGETNLDPMPYSIRVQIDKPPTVKITKPGEDRKLPANGLLHVEGSADDDLGIASLVLRMKKMDQGPALQPKPYQGGKVRLSDGTCPQMLDYLDNIDLASIKREDGKAYALKQGEVVEYWLEATDNCDYPQANVAESKHYKVTIGPPDDPNKQQQKKEQAKKQQQEHAQKQEEKLKEQQQKRDNERNEKQEQQADGKEKGKEQQNEPANGQQNQEPDREQNQRPDGQQNQPENQRPDGQRNQNPSGQQNQQNQGPDGQQNQDPSGQQNQQNQRPDGQQNQNPSGQQNQQNQRPDGQQNQNPSGQQNQQNQRSEGQQNQKPNGQQNQKPNGQQNPEGQQPSKDQSKAGDKSGTTGGQGQQSENNQGKDDPDRKLEQKVRQALDRREKQEQAQQQKGKNPDQQGNNEQKPAADQRNGGNQANGQATEKSGANREDNPMPNKDAPDQDKKRADSQKEERNQDRTQSGDKNKASKENPAGPNGSEPKNQSASDNGQGPKKDQTTDKNAGKGQDSNKNQSGREEGQPDKNSQAKENGQKKQQPGSGQKDKKDEAGAGERGDNQPRTPKNNGQGPKDGQKGQKNGQGDSGNRGQEKAGAGDPNEKNTESKEGDNQNPQAQGKPDDRPRKKPDSQKDGASGEGKKVSDKPDNKDDGQQAQRGAGKEKQKPGKPDATKDANGNAREQGTAEDGRPGSEKPVDDKSDQPATKAQAGQKGGSKDQGSSGDNKKEGLSQAAQERVKQLAKDLQSSDAKTRQEAERKVQEMLKNSRDPSQRQANADALRRAAEELQAKNGNQPKKSDQPNSDRGQAKGEEQGSGNRKRQQPGEADAGQTQEQSARQTGDQPDNGSKPGGQEQKAAGKGQTEKGNKGKEQGNNSADEDNPNRQSGKGGPKGATQPRDPGSAKPGEPDKGPFRDDRTEPGTAPDPRFQKQAGALQLKDLQKIDKNILKEAGVTPEEFERYKKGLEKRLREASAEPVGKDKLAAPERGNRNAPNVGLRRVERDPLSKPGTIDRQATAVPPAKYRAPLIEFSRRLEELKQPAPDK